MPRANRHYLPGYVWHITHRCHKREFLLKFSRDRQRWLDWLFEAKKRYGLVVLNYMATSNHIHLLVHDRDGGDTIPRSIQLAAGRVAQEFNQRKRRKGGFWEDRYHATAVQTDHHLVQCIVYMDLNMVRAGVVKHPSQWPHSGYGEIQKSPERYRLIDRAALMSLLRIGESEQLSLAHRSWIEETLRSEKWHRENRWSESIAVGSVPFIEEIKTRLGARGFGRRIISGALGAELREAQDPYQDHHFGPEMVPLSSGNTILWHVYDETAYS
jgi:putative transposase